MTKKVIIYARVSTREQANKGYSLDMQVDRVKQFFSLYSDEVHSCTEEYLEKGGSGKSLKRPVIIDVIEQIKSGKVSTLAVYKLDRLTRSVRDLQVILELIEDYDIRLISVIEQIDTRTSVGRFVANQIISIAQLELENIFERTTEGLIGSARKGNYVYSGAPVGYEKIDGKLLVLEHESQVVRRIFDLVRIEKYSIRAISLMLSAEKTLERSWTEEAVTKILKNKIYIGTYSIRDEVINDHSPTIVTKQVFEEVQEILYTKSHLNEFRYLFHSKCFSAKTSKKLEHKSTSKNGGESIYLYYVCPATTQRINQSMIVKQIKDDVDNYIFGLYKRKLKSKISSLKWYDAKISTLTQLYEEGLIDYDYFSYEIKNPEKRIRITEQKVNELFGRFKKWSIMTEDEKEKFIKRNILKIEVDMTKKIVTKVYFKKI